MLMKRSPLRKQKFKNKGPLRKKVATYTGVLDTIGEYANCVMAFSLYRLTVNYTGFCVRVRRASDNSEQDFGFSGSYVNTAAIETFCGAGDGFVVTWYNQASSGNNATQSTQADQPKIVDSGTFVADGLEFDGISHHFTITDYAGIQITSQDLAIYANFVQVNWGGYILAKNENNASAMQYSIVGNSGQYLYSIMEGGTKHSATVYWIFGSNKCLLNWTSDTVDMENSNGDTGTGSYSGTLTNRSNVRIGCRHDTGGNDGFNGMNLVTLLVFNNTQAANYNTLKANV